MCGVIAIISPKVQTVGENNIFKDMLVMDQLRGKDSVGLYGVSASGQCSYHKSTAHPSDFLQLKAVNSIIQNAATLVGHNRHATLGAVNSNNAHPFQHGHITLVHNGTLDRYPAMKNQAQFDTDSECVAWNLAQCESIKDTIEFIESLSGAFAFIWHDARDNSMWYIRNDERPLYSTTVSGAKYLCSERGILFAALDRRNVNVSSLDVLTEVPVGQLFKVTQDKTELVTVSHKVTLKKKSCTPVTTTYATYNQGNYNRGNVQSGVSDGNTKTYSANLLLDETGIMPYSWCDATITGKTSWGNRNLGTIECRLDNPDTGCKVIVYNVEVSDLNVNDKVQVQVTSLPMGSFNNENAKLVSDFTLRASELHKVQEDTDDTESLVICANCAEVVHEDSAYELNDGEHICKACYQGDAEVALYVNSKIK